MSAIYPTPPSNAPLILPPPEGPTLPSIAAGWAQWQRAVIQGLEITPQAGLL